MNKYLKYFETEQEYISYMQGSEVLRPNISLCEGTDDVHFNKTNIEITVRNTSTAPQSGYDVGSDIVLQINVKNIGDETITNINMESQLTGDEWTINSLAPGASKEFTAVYNVTEPEALAGSVTNVVTATGDNPSDNPTVVVDGVITTPAGFVST